MMMLKRIGNTFAKFRRDTAGGYSVEALMIFPLMVWAYLGMYIFFDAFRQQNVNLKASYTISDMLSRETTLINMDYLNGMNTVLDYLTYSRHPTYLRVTVVYYDLANDQHVLVWSRGTRGKPDLVQSDVDSFLTPQIPIMADTDTAIVVETWAAYEPMADVGIPAISFENLVVTSPRFAPQLNFEGVGPSGGTDSPDGSGGSGTI